jgi:hypothetical protein
MDMMRGAKKCALALALVLAGLILLGGLGACSKEEVRRTLPARQSF